MRSSNPRIISSPPHRLAFFHENSIVGGEGWGWGVCPPIVGENPTPGDRSAPVALAQVQVRGGEHHLHALGLGLQHAPPQEGQAVDLARAGGPVRQVVGVALD